MQRAQEAFDIRIAKRLETMTDKVSGTALFVPAEEEPPYPPIGGQILDDAFKHEANIDVPALHTLVPLLFRLESLLINLEREIEVTPAN